MTRTKDFWNVSGGTKKTKTAFKPKKIVPKASSSSSSSSFPILVDSSSSLSSSLGSVPTPLYFRGITFCTDSLSQSVADELSNLIRFHGGDCTALITQTADYLLCDPEVENKKLVQVARSMGLQTLDMHYVRDSIEANQLLPLHQYAQFATIGSVSRLHYSLPISNALVDPHATPSGPTRTATLQRPSKNKNKNKNKNGNETVSFRRSDPNDLFFKMCACFFDQTHPSDQKHIEETNSKLSNIGPQAWALGNMSIIIDSAKTAVIQSSSLRFLHADMVSQSLNSLNQRSDLLKPSFSSGSAGKAHLCLLSDTGIVWTCGKGSHGRTALESVFQYDSKFITRGLSKNTTTYFPLPLPIKCFGGHKIVQVACGNAHSLALSDKGEVWSWGMGHNGQLGHGNQEDLSQPKKIQQTLNGITVVQIAAGGNSSACIIDSSFVLTWGSNFEGQLGTRDQVDRLTPTRIQARLANSEPKQTDLLMANRIACGSNFMVCIGTTKRPSSLRPSALSSNRNTLEEIFTWGSNVNSQLGRPTDKNSCLIATAVEWDVEWVMETENRIQDIAPIEDISCGSRHTLVLLANGIVFGWGCGQMGRLGVTGGMMCDRLFPSILDISEPVMRISCGSEHSSVLTDSGKLFVMGSLSSSFGQMKKVDYYPQPTHLHSLENAPFLTSGGPQTIALVKDFHTMLFLHCTESNFSSIFLLIDLAVRSILSEKYRKTLNIAAHTESYGDQLEQQKILASLKTLVSESSRNQVEKEESEMMQLDSPEERLRIKSLMTHEMKGQSAGYDAAREDYYKTRELVRLCISQHRLVAHENRTYLHMAIEQQNPEMVVMFGEQLRCGLGAKDGSYQTPAHVASRSPNHVCFWLLIHAAAVQLGFVAPMDIDCEVFSRLRDLSETLKRRASDESKRKDKDSKADQVMTGDMYRSFMVPIINLNLRAKMAICDILDLNAKNNFQHTALSVGVESNNYGAVLLLLEMGADHAVHVSQQKTSALHIAVQNGNEQIAKLLVRKASSIVFKDGKKKTPLDYCKSFTLRSELKAEAFKHDCFISYSHSDSAQVDQIVRRLESHGLRCWIDSLRLEAGSNWRASIGDGLRSSEVVVFCVSSRSAISEWCLKELYLAEQLQKYVVVMCLEDVTDYEPLMDNLVRNLLHRSHPSHRAVHLYTPGRREGLLDKNLIDKTAQRVADVVVQKRKKMVSMFDKSSSIEAHKQETDRIMRTAFVSYDPIDLSTKSIICSQLELACFQWKTYQNTHNNTELSEADSITRTMEFYDTSSSVFTKHQQLLSDAMERARGLSLQETLEEEDVILGCCAMIVVLSRFSTHLFHDRKRQIEVAIRAGKPIIVVCLDPLSSMLTDEDQESLLSGCMRFHVSDVDWSDMFLTAIRSLDNELELDAAIHRLCVRQRFYQSQLFRLTSGFTTHALPEGIDANIPALEDSSDLPIDTPNSKASISLSMSLGSSSLSSSLA